MSVYALHVIFDEFLLHLSKFFAQRSLKWPDSIVTTAAELAASSYSSVLAPTHVSNGLKDGCFVHIVAVVS